jgi:hypothetical protein
MEMSGHEPGKTTLIQTEYINDAEIAQMRRDQGVLDPAPIAGDNSVLVYSDFLMNATVITGNGGATKVVLNNVSAHLTTDAQYTTVAQQLLQVMAPGGEVEIQWDDSDEKGDPNVKGTRGHVDGDRLLAKLQEINPKITGQKLPALKYPYSINAAKSNKFENPGFTNPDPQYRMLIKF